MKNKILLISFIGLFILSLGFYSCKKNDIERLPLESVNIDMYEYLFSIGREFNLNVYTDRTDYSITSFIRYDSKIEGNKITIDLHDIEVGNYDGAAVALGGAPAYVNLGSLQQGFYDLQINVVDNVNEGSLSVESNFFILNFNATNSLTINYDTLWRIPSGAMWGYIGYQTPEYQEAAESFVDTLQKIGAAPLNLPKGYYGYFEVDSAGNFTQPVNDNYTYIIEYYYDYFGSMEKLEMVYEYYDFIYHQLYIVLYWIDEGELKSIEMLPG